MSGPRRLLVLAAVVVLAVAVVAAGVRILGEDDDVETVTLMPGATATGTFTSLSAEAEYVERVATPFTIDGTPGTVSGTITGALVGGARRTIEWDGQRPLVVTGGPGLEPGPLHVEVTPSEHRFATDVGARGFLAGTYRVESPFAVTFDADGETILVTRGGATVTSRAQELVLEGPGSVDATGRFDVDGRRSSRIRIERGPYSLTVRSDRLRLGHSLPPSSNQ